VSKWDENVLVWQRNSTLKQSLQMMGLKNIFGSNLSVPPGFKPTKPIFHTIYHFVLFSGYKNLKLSTVLLRYFVDNQL